LRVPPYLGVKADAVDADGDTDCGTDDEVDAVTGVDSDDEAIEDVAAHPLINKPRVNTAMSRISSRFFIGSLLSSYFIFV
jgi:hypothetical protein